MVRDALTGVANRRGVLERLQHAWDSTAVVSVAMLDIDEFKSINDRFGHLAGDEVLAEVARRVSSACRGSDVIGRYGGEEFLAVLPNADLRSSYRVSERIRQVVGSSLIQARDVELHVTISAGVASRDSKNSDVLDLITAADQAMFQAKESGRNRVCVAEQAPTSTIQVD